MNSSAVVCIHLSFLKIEKTLNISRNKPLCFYHFICVTRKLQNYVAIKSPTEKYEMIMRDHYVDQTRTDAIIN